MKQNQTLTVMDAGRMTSLEIAQVTGKMHKDVMKAIRNMEPAWLKVNGRNFALVDYTDSKGEQRPCYSLSKMECLYIATKFNDEARAKLVIRWQQLESEKLRVKSEIFATAQGGEETTKQPEILLESMSSEALFAHISQVVVRDQLFLDPAFDRQAAIDHFHLSKERIGAAFSQGSDYASISDFINECRLEYAVNLLCNQSSLPITQIAQACGFSDANYFGRKFKARFGLSPTDYRVGNS